MDGGAGRVKVLRSIDVVAIVAIVACSFLIYTGHNGFIASILATIIGWYFGRRSGKDVVEEDEKEDD
jgi:heme O synthase-like polyprenyltransferase